MSSEFIPLAEVLRVQPVGLDVQPLGAPRAETEPPAPAPAPAPPRSAAPAEILAALRDARLFRARLADALDAARAKLLRELAAGVLARELRTAPCELDAIARGIGERAPVVRFRVAPGVRLQIAGAEVLEDPALSAEDVVAELCGGEIDARLGVRLADVLEALA